MKEAGNQTDRQEAVSLLRELMNAFESFHIAQAVALEYNKANDSWELHVSWKPNPSDSNSLAKIVADHGLEMITTNGQTVFRSARKA